MSLYLTNSLKIPVGKLDDHEYITKSLFNLLRVGRKDFLSYSLYKRSIDARNKSDVHFVCSFVVDCRLRPQNAQPFTPQKNVFDDALHVCTDATCIVVGAGPAGLFAARYLSQCGVKTIVVERGEDVNERKKTVQTFFDGGKFAPNSNVQFGLGGAGAFSDGKLTSGLSGSPLGRSVFCELANCGAPNSILVDALPHIGTDNLQKVVANLRDRIVGSGGSFMFNTQVTDLLIQDGVVRGVTVETDGKTADLFADYVIFACGHSARDTFKMLENRGADMQFKPFAVGLRIEHDRKFIDTAQYGELFATHRDLGAATYKLTHKCADGHGCYSFCMCPGGVVVAANSEPDTVVVNGMSDYSRSAVNSNSALVVTIDENDVERYGYGRDVFAGLRFQRDLENKAYLLGGGNYIAPCQNVSDFVANRLSAHFDVTPSYPRGVKSCNLRELLPRDLSDNLAEALVSFDRKIHGFGTFGVLTGVETRTSSPVRILRDETYQSNLKRLYPSGEGAGYAGGIVSSAVDGLKVAMAIIGQIRGKNLSEF